MSEIPPLDPSAVQLPESKEQQQVAQLFPEVFLTDVQSTPLEPIDDTKLLAEAKQEDTVAKNVMHEADETNELIKQAMKESLPLNATKVPWYYWGAPLIVAVVVGGVVALVMLVFKRDDATAEPTTPGRAPTDGSGSGTDSHTNPLPVDTIGVYHPPASGGDVTPRVPTPPAPPEPPHQPNGDGSNHPTRHFVTHVVTQAVAASPGASLDDPSILAALGLPPLFSKVVKFTEWGVYEVPTHVSKMRVLLVGGGGAGGSGGSGGLGGLGGQLNAKDKVVATGGGGGSGGFGGSGGGGGCGEIVMGEIDVYAGSQVHVAPGAGGTLADAGSASRVWLDEGPLLTFSARPGEPGGHGGDGGRGGAGVMGHAESRYIPPPKPSHFPHGANFPHGGPGHTDTNYAGGAGGTGGTGGAGGAGGHSAYVPGAGAPKTLGGQGGGHGAVTSNGVLLNHSDSAGAGGAAGSAGAPGSSVIASIPSPVSPIVLPPGVPPPSNGVLMSNAAISGGSGGAPVDFTVPGGAGGQSPWVVYGSGGNGGAGHAGMHGITAVDSNGKILSDPPKNAPTKDPSVYLGQEGRPGVVLLSFS